MFRDRTDAGREFGGELGGVLLAAPQTAQAVRCLVDERVCLQIAPDFQSLDQFYGNFSRVDDAEGIAVLGQWSTSPGEMPMPHTPSASYTLTTGHLPLLISIPHLGTWLPPQLAQGMAPCARSTQDTDWHLDRLYGFALGMGASVLKAHVSRYVIDLNRPPDGESLYPGQTTTGLCPTETFRGESLYPQGAAPDAAEQQGRLQTYWQPYHAALAQELARLRARHGSVLLWDAHSIASELPRLFDGRLPDLNLGSNMGRSCAASVLEAVAAVAIGSSYSHVVDGRFKGGYITRHYGQPTQGVHAIQLEMVQALYMDEAPPFAYQEQRAAQVQPLLRDMLHAGLAGLGALQTP